MSDEGVNPTAMNMHDDGYSDYDDAQARHDAILDGVLVRLENTNTWLYVHDRDRCIGQDCTVHNRSDHHMRSWPQNWRSDRQLMERICPDKGIGHPDPDEIHLELNGRGVHGCDGCCTP